MNYNLEGELRMGGTIPLDNTLTLVNAAAQAKATGDAFKAEAEKREEHINDKSNPHGTDKVQVGLGRVDNTSDIEKPVSNAQAVAIAEAKQAGLDAQANMVVKEEGKGLSSNDFTDAYKTKLEGLENFVLEDKSVTKEKLADAYASPSVAVTIPLAGWVDNTVEVDVSGVTASNHVIVTPHPGSFVMWAECMVRATAQGDGTITFACEDVPGETINANVLIVG